jgi:hypothetical protein
VRDDSPHVISGDAATSFVQVREAYARFLAGDCCVASLLTMTLMGDLRLSLVAALGRCKRRVIQMPAKTLACRMAKRHVSPSFFQMLVNRRVTL